MGAIVVRKMPLAACSAIILAAAWKAPVVAEETPDLDFEGIFVFGNSLELTGVVTRNTQAWRGSN